LMSEVQSRLDSASQYIWHPSRSAHPGGRGGAGARNVPAIVARATLQPARHGPGVGERVVDAGGAHGPDRNGIVEAERTGVVEISREVVRPVGINGQLRPAADRDAVVAVDGAGIEGRLRRSQHKVRPRLGSPQHLPSLEVGLLAALAAEGSLLVTGRQAQRTDGVSQALVLGEDGAVDGVGAGAGRPGDGAALEGVHAGARDPRHVHLITGGQAQHQLRVAAAAVGLVGQGRRAVGTPVHVGICGSLGGAFPRGDLALFPSPRRAEDIIE
jgi:hypothetical protein